MCLVGSSEEEPMIDVWDQSTSSVSRLGPGLYRVENTSAVQSLSLSIARDDSVLEPLFPRATVLRQQLRATAALRTLEVPASAAAAILSSAASSASVRVRLWRVALEGRVAECPASFVLELLRVEEALLVPLRHYELALNCSSAGATQTQAPTSTPNANANANEKNQFALVMHELAIGAAQTFAIRIVDRAGEFTTILHAVASDAQSSSSRLASKQSSSSPAASAGQQLPNAGAGRATDDEADNSAAVSISITLDPMAITACVALVGTLSLIALALVSLAHIVPPAVHQQQKKLSHSALTPASSSDDSASASASPNRRLSGGSPAAAADAMSAGESASRVCCRAMLVVLSISVRAAAAVCGSFTFLLLLFFIVNA